ncbi:Sterol 3-beta-glucosyltransferase [Arachis hypogaea]|nr:Sterol 3-beta-glucosyltransferase [Arachis hypogaea]
MGAISSMLLVLLILCSSGFGGIVFGLLNFSSNNRAGSSSSPNNEVVSYGNGKGAELEEKRGVPSGANPLYNRWMLLLSENMPKKYAAEGDPTGHEWVPALCDVSIRPACNSADPDTHVAFNADAIIANPPAYGHIHVAEFLKVPLHIFFTMPWTPTYEFPHPLSRVKQQMAYRLSYQIVNSLIWLGIRDLINEFRKKKLKLRPITYLSGSYTSPPNMPYGYIWSPYLVPKPKDWGPNIDVVGFCFLNLASDYEPPISLLEWLEEGEKEGKKPIYIGFGSLVHHGGAGTTAVGLRAACPTIIVPFFGDQPFWGERVHAKGVGRAPIPVDEFTLGKLVNAINYMLKPEVKRNAEELADAMKHEDGVAGAVAAFYKHYHP